MEFPSRRRAPSRENVVPLINVVFLLLIFFMLTATLRPAELATVALPIDDAPSRNNSSGWPVLRVGSEGELALEGREIDREALAAVGPRLELRADANVPARVLLPLLDALDRAGVEEVEVVTRAR